MKRMTREEAIMAVKEVTGMSLPWNDRHYEALQMAIKALDEPEPKTGNWEIYVISAYDGEGCKCSECGFEGVPYWDYCPNCGADMRGKQDENR